jgi:hypothetical protein
MNEQVGSPAQQLMGRKTKTFLPTSAKLLAPKKIRMGWCKVIPVEHLL